VAASSLYCYLFQIKDRHNGNIMIDQRGHIMHIDFGFMMGSAPGGAFSLEDAPFKLTREMVDVMGGLDSRGYQDFAELFKDGFLAVRREYIKVRHS
jgi:phosphatidylinositol 4-kinase B